MMTSENFLKWFNTTPNYFGYGEYFEGDNPPNVSLIYLLHLNREDLKAFTKEALEHLENSEDFMDLKTGVYAYSQFQDILGLTFQANDSLSLWNRHYCYYEGLVYLRESLSSWLDKNILAAMTLLRPFLELAVIHLYWYIRCETAGSGYNNFYSWLEGKKDKPPFKNQLDYVFENLPSKNSVASKRMEQIKELLNNAFKGMSAYNHTPKVDESIVTWGGGPGNISLDSFYYYLANLNILLRQIIYLYVLAYPMSMFPVDRYRKWAFGGPVGIYFDQNNHSILKAYLGESNIIKLQEALACLPEVEERLQWFNTQPDLTDEELETEWKRFVEESKTNFEANDKGHRIAISKSHNRAFGWFANYLHTPSNDAEKISDEMLEKITRRLREW